MRERDEREAQGWIERTRREWEKEKELEGRKRNGEREEKNKVEENICIDTFTHTQNLPRINGIFPWVLIVFKKVSHFTLAASIICIFKWINIIVQHMYV